MKGFWDEAAFELNAERIGSPQMKQKSHKHDPFQMTGSDVHKIEKLFKSVYAQKGEREIPSPDTKWRMDVMRSIRLTEGHTHHQNGIDNFSDMFQQVVFRLSPFFALMALIMVGGAILGEVFGDDMISTYLLNYSNDLFFLSLI